MAYKEAKSTIKIDRELYKQIQQAIQNSGISVTELMTKSLRDLLDDENHNNKLKTNFVMTAVKEIRIVLSKSEIAFLEAEREMHGFISLKRECEYRILNSIYDKKEYYTNKDIEQFTQLRNELNAIGRNLNVLVRRLNNPNAKIEYKNLEKFLEFITHNIQKTTDLLSENIIKNQERF